MTYMKNATIKVLGFDVEFYERDCETMEKMILTVLEWPSDGLKKKLAKLSEDQFTDLMAEISIELEGAMDIEIK